MGLQQLPHTVSFGVIVGFFFKFISQSHNKSEQSQLLLLQSPGPVSHFYTTTGKIRPNL